MEHILAAFAGNDILTEASDADRLRLCIEDRLTEPDRVVVLDFAGVNGVSERFVEALLGPLFDVFGAAMADRVLLDHCSAAVLNDFKCVAETGRSAVITAVDRGPGARRGRQAA